MRVLILNWRDIKNKRSGGAEVLTHEIARRWVQQGVEVVQFSEMIPGGKKEEILDGVRIIRKGTSGLHKLDIPVHVAAFLWYIKNGMDKFDIVIDEIHGLPFFTPFYVKEKKIALICEVADKIWDSAFNFPFNILGKFIERNYFNFYKNIPFLTISSSTKKDLVDRGIKDDNITILPMGISTPKKMGKYKKEDNFVLIFVGRILKAKGIEDLLYVFKEFYSINNKAKLWIIGRGESSYEKKIRQLCKSLNIDSGITFFGYVSQEKKFELMSKAHILLAPSMKEGWGLIVPEAALCKTPSIVYDVAGLRDVVKDGITGIIINPNPKDMCNAIKHLFANPKLYKYLQSNAFLEAKKYNWDITAKVALAKITSLV